MPSIYSLIVKFYFLGYGMDCVCINYNTLTGEASYQPGPGTILLDSLISGCLLVKDKNGA